MNGPGQLQTGQGAASGDSVVDSSLPLVLGHVIRLIGSVRSEVDALQTTATDAQTGDSRQ